MPPDWERAAVELFMQGKAQDAMAILDRAIAKEPNVAGPYFLKGSLLAIVDKRAAMACIDQGLAVDPKSAQGWANKGAILVDQGRLEDGIAACDRALVIDRLQQSALFSKATALLELVFELSQDAAIHALIDGLKCADCALFFHLEDPIYWRLRGKLLMAGRHYGQARYHFLQAQRLSKQPMEDAAELEAKCIEELKARTPDPRSTPERTTVSLADSLYRDSAAALQRRDGAARKLVDYLIGLDPTPARYWTLLAQAQEQSYDEGKAAMAFAIALSLDRNDRTAEEGLRRNVRAAGWDRAAAR